MPLNPNSTSSRFVSRRHARKADPRNSSSSSPFFSQIAHFEVENLASGKTFNLKPEKAFYPASKSVMTESAISINLKEDVYISLSERLDTGEWIAKIQTKPFIRFIWLGALLMTLGGVFAFTRRVFIR